MEPDVVRIARLEEAMVTVKGDTRYIRNKMDDLMWKLALVSGGGSVVTALIVTIITARVMSKG